MTNTFEVKYILPDTTEVVTNILEGIEDYVLDKWVDTCNRHNVKIVNIQAI